MLRIISSFDYLSSKENIRVNSQKRFQSCYGGLLSIISLLFCVIMTTYLTLNFIYKKDPKITHSFTVLDLRENFNFTKNDVEFFFALQFANSTYYNDETIVNIIATQIEIKYIQENGNIKAISKETSLQVKKCNEVYSDAEIKSKYNLKFPLDYFFCLMPDKGKIGGYKYGEFFNTIKIQIVKCNNNTLTQSIKKCQTADDINKSIENGYLTIFAADAAIDPKNYEYPVKKYLKYFFHRTSYKSSLNYNFEYNKLLFNHDQGKIFENLNILSFAKLKSIMSSYYNYYPIISETNNTNTETSIPANIVNSTSLQLNQFDYNFINQNIISSIEIYTSNYQSEITISYQKLQDVVTYIGGFIKAINILGFVIYYIYFKPLILVNEIFLHSLGSLDYLIKNDTSYCDKNKRFLNFKSLLNKPFSLKTSSNKRRNEALNEDYFNITSNDKPFLSNNNKNSLNKSQIRKKPCSLKCDTDYSWMESNNENLEYKNFNKHKELINKFLSSNFFFNNPDNKGDKDNTKKNISLNNENSQYYNSEKFDENKLNLNSEVNNLYDKNNDSSLNNQINKNKLKILSPNTNVNISKIIENEEDIADNDNDAMQSSFLINENILRRREKFSNFINNTNSNCNNTSSKKKSETETFNSLKNNNISNDCPDRNKKIEKREQRRKSKVSKENKFPSQNHNLKRHSCFSPNLNFPENLPIVSNKLKINTNKNKSVLSNFGKNINNNDDNLILNENKICQITQIGDRSLTSDNKYEYRIKEGFKFSKNDSLEKYYNDKNEVYKNKEQSRESKEKTKDSIKQKKISKKIINDSKYFIISSDKQPNNNLTSTNLNNTNYILAFSKADNSDDHNENINILSEITSQNDDLRNKETGFDKENTNSRHLKNKEIIKVDIENKHNKIKCEHKSLEKKKANNKNLLSIRDRSFSRMSHSINNCKTNFKFQNVLNNKNFLSGYKVSESNNNRKIDDENTIQDHVNNKQNLYPNETILNNNNINNKNFKENQFSESSSPQKKRNNKLKLSVKLQNNSNANRKPCNNTYNNEQSLLKEGSPVIDYQNKQNLTPKIAINHNRYSTFFSFNNGFNSDDIKKNYPLTNCNNYVNQIYSNTNNCNYNKNIYTKTNDGESNIINNLNNVSEHYNANRNSIIQKENTNINIKSLTKEENKLLTDNNHTNTESKKVLKKCKIFPKSYSQGIYSMKKKIKWQMFWDYWCYFKKGNKFGKLLQKQLNYINQCISIDNLCKISFEIKFLKMVLLNKDFIFDINNIYENMHIDNTRINELRQYLFTEKENSVADLFDGDPSQKVELIKKYFKIFNH